jgi:hypothetical protein
MRFEPTTPTDGSSSLPSAGADWGRASGPSPFQVNHQSRASTVNGGLGGRAFLRVRHLRFLLLCCAALNADEGKNGLLRADRP